MKFNSHLVTSLVDQARGVQPGTLFPAKLRLTCPVCRRSKDSIQQLNDPAKAEQASVICPECLKSLPMSDLDNHVGRDGQLLVEYFDAAGRKIS